MPNPTIEKLYEGMEIARKANVDLILAVGGGSVCDYAKALSVSVNCDEDPWDKYWIIVNKVDKNKKINKAIQNELEIKGYSQNEDV